MEKNHRPDRLGARCTCTDMGGAGRRRAVCEGRGVRAQPSGRSAERSYAGAGAEGGARRRRDPTDRPNEEVNEPLPTAAWQLLGGPDCRVNTGLVQTDVPVSLAVPGNLGTLLSGAKAREGHAAYAQAPRAPRTPEAHTTAYRAGQGATAPWDPGAAGRTALADHVAWLLMHRERPINRSRLQ